MNWIKWPFIIITVILVCGCDQIGIVEKSKLDNANSEIAHLKKELEQANYQDNIIRKENEELKRRLEELEEERDDYLEILKKACHKSDQLESIMDHDDHVSFWELEQTIKDLRECLGYKRVYYNYSSEPFSSQSTTVTKQPDYLFK